MKPLGRHHFGPLKNFPGLYVSEQTISHQVILGENGAILIRRINLPGKGENINVLARAIVSKNRDPQNSPVFTPFLDKPGADGKTVWEYAEAQRVKST